MPGKIDLRIFSHKTGDIILTKEQVNSNAINNQNYNGNEIHGKISR